MSYANSRPELSFLCVWEEPTRKAKLKEVPMKSFSISQEVVWEAYKQVKKNKGAAGIDLKSVEEFDKDLNDNLYKIWNRMSSGTYFPPPVRTVAIPKDDGISQRLLGIPTVGDRVAQTVVKAQLEPLAEPHFYPDSFGYRPNKSAHDAIGKARERCWSYDWVIDLDIKGFFDNLDHQLAIQSVKEFTDNKWILLFIERWLKAPAQLEDGTQIPRDKGTPQGGVISPLLANIFLHFAFDSWMQKEFPTVPFERYADDVIVHCKTERQAVYIKDKIKTQLTKWKLELHPEKTKIVYCKDDQRKGSYPNEKFDFLGYTFRTRQVRSKQGNIFVGFSPAASNKARKAMNLKMRRWEIQRRSDMSLGEIAFMVNPMVQGWINYYGKFHKTALYWLFKHLNFTLSRWVRRKYKRFRFRKRESVHWLGEIAKDKPDLFAHWRIGIKPAVG